MKLWDDIRSYFYHRNIAAKLRYSNSKSIITNLNDAKFVGIIYNGTDTANDTIIAKFADELREHGKAVDLMAYVADNKTESKLGIPMFNKKSVSWTRVPQAENALQFAEENFDLLIAAFTDQSIPLEYVVKISKAKWKVGCYTENKTDYYDLMVNMGERTDLPYFIEQAKYYLNQIKYDSR